MQTSASHLVKRLAILAVVIYRNTLSIILLPACRFYPTCSEYAVEAIRKYGLIKGSWATAGRLLRCHPFSRGGLDPVQ